MGINSVRNVVVDFLSYSDSVENQEYEFTKESVLFKLLAIFSNKTFSLNSGNETGISLDFYYPNIFEY